MFPWNRINITCNQSTTLERDPMTVDDWRGKMLPFRIYTSAVAARVEGGWWMVALLKVLTLTPYFHPPSTLTFLRWAPGGPSLPRRGQSSPNFRFAAPHAARRRRRYQSRFAAKPYILPLIASPYHCLPSCVLHHNHVSHVLILIFVFPETRKEQRYLVEIFISCYTWTEIFGRFVNGWYSCVIDHAQHCAG